MDVLAETSTRQDVCLNPILAPIIQKGVRVGYQGPEQLLLSKPHKSAEEAPDILIADIQKQLHHHRLTILPQQH